MNDARNWRDHAVCVNIPAEYVDVFHPASRGTPPPETVEKANRIISAYCARCPVQETCIREAITAARTVAEICGIYGGIYFPDAMSARQLKRVRDDLAARGIYPTDDPATPARCGCRGMECPACGPRLALEARNNRAGSWTTGARGPDLQTAPYSRPPIASVNGRPVRRTDVPLAPSGAASTASIQTTVKTRRSEQSRAARMLNNAGVEWRQVKEWALDNGAKRSDVKAMQPKLVDKYLAEHAAKTPAEATA